MKPRDWQSTMHLLLPIVMLLIAARFIFGCAAAAPVGVTMAVGTIYLNKERAGIRITEDEHEAKNCKFVKHVKASSYWGGLAFQEKALEKTISDLTHESVEAGANLLLVRSKHKSFNGSKSEGDAYLCPTVTEEMLRMWEEKNENNQRRTGKSPEEL